MAEKVTGPKSYFPSIEKKYGRPIELLDGPARHRPRPHPHAAMQWLKTEHGMGHGHANALVGVFRSEHDKRS
jgi:Domain of unknown function (DUF4287)